MSDLKSSRDPWQSAEAVRPGRRKLVYFAFAAVWLVVLTALFYAVENWRGARALNAYVAGLPPAERNFSRDSLIPMPVSDEENFARTPFLAPLLDYQTDQNGIRKPRDPEGATRAREFGKELRLPRSPGAWRHGKHLDLGNVCREWNAGGGEQADRKAAALEILQILGKYDAVFDELQNARQRPQSRFNVNYAEEEPWAILLPHLAPIKNLTQFLTIRTCAQLESGKTEEAFQGLLLMFRFMDSTRREPMLISQLVRFAILEICTQTVWEGVQDRRWSDAQLRNIQTEIEHLDFPADLLFAMRAERVWAMIMIDSFQRRRHLLGDSSDLLSMMLNDGTQNSIQYGETLGWVLRFCPSGWIDFEKLNYNLLMDQAILSSIDARQVKVSPSRSRSNADMLQQQLNDSRSPLLTHRFFAKFLLPSLNPTLQKSAVAQTTVRQIATACAIERFRQARGQFPENLQELLPNFLKEVPQEVVTEAPLVYRRNGETGYILYSRGWNNTDEGGSMAKGPGKSETPDLQNGDWVWPIKN